MIHGNWILLFHYQNLKIKILVSIKLYWYWKKYFYKNIFYINIDFTHQRKCDRRALKLRYVFIGLKWCQNNVQYPKRDKNNWADGFWDSRSSKFCVSKKFYTSTNHQKPDCCTSTNCENQYAKWERWVFHFKCWILKKKEKLIISV